VKRRELITLIGGAAVGWPLAARAQQPDRVRRIGVLQNLAADDPFLRPFNHRLQELGWTEGQNLRVDYRWAAGDVGRLQKEAVDLVRLQPDAILVSGSVIRGSTASHPNHPDRVRQRRRSGRPGVHRKLGAPRR
jgi:putative tryptophan/tyrosine transport system substrate-binding protein